MSDSASRKKLFPTKDLPAGYAHLRTIDLQTDRRLLILLNLAGLVLVLPAAWFFLALAVGLRTDIRSLVGLIRPPVSWWLELLLLTGSAVLFILLHELVHGLFFWLFTTERPGFGFRGAYAFASASGWFFPLRQYTWIGLSPLVLLSLIGILIIPLVPLLLLPPLLFGLIVNASGAVGDLYVVFWLFRQPGDLLVEDFGDRISAYHRENHP